MAALVYQSLWLRSFGLVFGSTTDAVALVLVIFMGGLALGAALAARRRPGSRPLRAYALVEMAVGVSTCATLPLLRGLPRLYASVDAVRSLEGPADVLARSAAAAAVLLLPTMLLGATMPLAVESQARQGRDVHASLGRLYLLNTLGGAAGVALAPFVLLPELGLTGALAAAALVNGLVGLVAWRWSLETGEAASAEVPLRTETAIPNRPQEPDGTSRSRPQTALFPALAAMSGAFTFGLEVVWTRSLALVLGSSVYAFASMLLAVLLGLSVGALVYDRWGRRLEEPARAVGGLLLAAGAAGLFSMLVLGQLPAMFLALMRVLPVSFGAHASAGLGLALLALMPVAVVLGATFPLLLHLAETGGAQQRTGRLYAWNTAGAMAGALLTDLVLVRALGLQGSSAALAGLAAAAGTAAALAARGRAPALAAAVGGVVVVAALVAAPRFRPWDPLLMASGVYEYGLEWKDRPGFRLPDLAQERRILFYEEGQEAVVAVAERAGSLRRFLSVNGKTDAGSGAEDVLTQKLIAHLPLLLHEDPKSALVVGWGAGATAAAAALHPVERLECVEIEPATFRAAGFFGDLSAAVREDPRFRVVFRDGRTHLLRSRERWDVIVSEPSNPWITGVANLFTREFYEAVRPRLAPRGVFGQWFHYYRFEPADVKVEIATFASVFPHASLWLVPPTTGPDGPRLAADLLLVGSAEPHSLDWPRLRARLRRPRRRGPPLHRRCRRPGRPRRGLGHGGRGLDPLRERPVVSPRHPPQHRRAPAHRAAGAPPQPDAARRSGPPGPGTVRGARRGGSRSGAAASGPARGGRPVLLDDPRAPVRGKGAAGASPGRFRAGRVRGPLAGRGLGQARAPPPRPEGLCPSREGAPRLPAAPPRRRRRVAPAGGRARPSVQVARGPSGDPECPEARPEGPGGPGASRLSDPASGWPGGGSGAVGRILGRSPGRSALGHDRWNSGPRPCVSALTRRSTMSAARIRALSLALSGTAFGLAATACAHPSWGHPWAPGTLVGVTVSVEGSSTPLYPDPRGTGRYYLEAREGARYEILVENRTRERLGVAVSVDGLNVISGERASGDGRLYVLDPWGSTLIRGWRVSLRDIHRFTFVDEKGSYAARSGKANGRMGWIEVSVFRSRGLGRLLPPPRPGSVGGREDDGDGRTDEGPRSWDEAARTRDEAHPVAPAPATPAPAPEAAEERDADAAAKRADVPEAKGPAEGLSRRPVPTLAPRFPGTGWGSRQDDPVVLVDFQPEPYPAERLTLRYEYAATLRALGIPLGRDHARDRLRDRERGEWGFAKPPSW